MLRVHSDGPHRLALSPAEGMCVCTQRWRGSRGDLIVRTSKCTLLHEPLRAPLPPPHNEKGTILNA